MPGPLPSPASFRIAGEIRARAARLGFDRVGFCDATVLPAQTAHFERWLAAGMHADMGWLERGRQRRLDPSRVLEGARSFVVVALSYARSGMKAARTRAEAAQEPGRPDPRGTVARYARGDDYHRVMGDWLIQIEELIEGEAPGERALAYVDTGPFLERLWAARAGIGWIGRNSLVLNEEMGSYFFLGLVVTTLHLPADEPAVDRCGSCTLCIEACPTAAIVEGRLVDSRRCISYHTIELRGPVPGPYRAAMGERVFGCDDCQQICPWNRPQAAQEPERLCLSSLLLMTQEEYLERFRGSAVKRATWRGLRRNAAIALGNAAASMADERPEQAAGIATLLEDAAANVREDPLVRDHAAWSASRVRDCLRDR
jgi:epoxyqueuosine reductase